MIDLRSTLEVVADSRIKKSEVNCKLEFQLRLSSKYETSNDSIAWNYRLKGICLNA